MGSHTKHEEHPAAAAGPAATGPRKGKVGIRVVGRPDSLEQRLYLPEVVKGLGLTAKHFFANLFGRKYTVTVEYPEQKVKYPERNRGLHRLMLREDGEVRCVACMLCPTVCPARRTRARPSGSTDRRRRKRPYSRRSRVVRVRIGAAAVWPPSSPQRRSLHGRACAR